MRQGYRVLGRKGSLPARMAGFTEGVTGRGLEGGVGELTWRESIFALL